MPQRTEYLAVIDRIAALQREKNKLESKAADLRDRTGVIHAELLLDIGLARDEKGKPIYSNEDLRRAKLSIELDQNKEFVQLRSQLREIDTQVRDICVEYNKMVDHKYLLMLELGIPADTENEKYPDIH